MMDPMVGTSRGYCFITYADKKGAREAVSKVGPPAQIYPGFHIEAKITKMILV